MELTDPLDGVEYDERHVARLNEELKGVEFVDNGDRWRVFKVDFDAEHKEPVCFYFDAKLGDKGTVDDCEYSAVDEVQEWIANHRRRLKAEEAQNMDGPPPKKKSRAERKADRDKNKNDELQKASEDAAAPKKIQSDPLSGRYPCPAGCGRTFSHPPAAVQHGKVCGKPKKKKKKAHEFLAEMKAKYEKDPEGVAAQFKALIDDESTRPAIEAIIKHGMCECAGAHANLCAWILMMWIAATRFRMEHRDAAPERLASMDDEAKTAYLARSMKQIPKSDGDVEAQLETAASGAWRTMEGLQWPPEHKFVEATCRRSIEKDLAPSSRWSGSDRASKLDNMVMKECGTSPDDLRKLNESQKIDMLVEEKRQKYVSPLQRITGNHELFDALVTYPITLDEMVRLVKTIVAMAHGDTLFTNRHCVVVDARGVLKRRGEYLEAESRGKIKNLENFYSGPGDREDRLETGLKLTRFLQKQEDLPECLKTVRGRISIFGEDDAKLSVDSLLTATDVARCHVLLGAVRDVENTKEAALGRVVVTCAIEIGSRTELWHVLGTPAHFAMLNPFTINCFMILASKVLPTLALGYRQSPSLVPRLKMITSEDGGLLVGDSGDGPMKADVKSVFPKIVKQMDGVFARAVKVIGENQISNASARLLAARVESASLSGVLQSLESRDDGLGAGFGVNGDALTKLIDSMKDVVDISKAVGPLRHILCSCPTPDPTPPPNPQPQPTNQNPIDLRIGWSHAEWNGWAADDEDGDG